MPDTPPRRSARRRATSARTPARAKRPELIAAVDVGATAVRLLIAETTADGLPRVIESLVHPIALGADTFRLGHVTPETLRALCRVMSNFAGVMEGYRVTARRAIATSALRDASNRELVVDRVRHSSGLSVDIIDVVEESRLAYQILTPSMAPFLSDPRAYSLVFSLGGGVTEMMLLEGRDLTFASSRRLGTARVLYEAGADRLDAAHSILESTVHNIIDSALDLYREYPVARLFVNNDQLYRAAARQGAHERDRAVVLPAADVRAMAERIQHDGGAADRARAYGMTQADAELLGPALLILRRMLESLPVPEVVFADVDTITAVADELNRAHRGEHPAADFRRQIVRAAHAMGVRYGYHREHARHVTALSLKLFDALAGFLDLGADDRPLLEVAAILHDIGMYVSESAHHKHGAYLVRWSEIIGVEEADRILVSQVIRYHRRALPSPSHEEFGALTPSGRLRVQKMAGLLRIADALDRAHDQMIADVHVDIGDEDILLRVDARSPADLAVAEAALHDKGRLLELITGLRLRLRRHDASVDPS